MADYELTYPGGVLPLDAVDGTEAPAGVQISKLLSTTGRVTFDPGFGNTAACNSAITFIDGDEGILRYRGIPIEQLAKESTFIETSYLLIYGELPNATQLEDFRSRIAKHTMLHEDLRSFFNGFRHDAHPMSVLNSAVSALSTFYQDSLDPFDADQVELSSIRLMAKVPTIAATASGLPSKPATMILPVRPAASTAATAPSAMVSLPAMIPLMPGLLCRIVSVLVKASCWSQLAVSCATDFMFGY